MISSTLRPDGWPEVLWQEVIEALGSGLTSKIRKVLQKVRTLPEEFRGKPFRLGIVRTFTIEAQLDVLTLAISVLPCQVKIKVAKLDNIEQELLDPTSDLLRWQPDVVLVLWRLEELIPYIVEYSQRIPEEKRADGILALTERIKYLVHEYLNIFDAPLLLSTLPLPQTSNHNDLHNLTGRRITVENVNATLLECASKNSRISIFDFSGWAARVGAAAFDHKMDFYARQPIAVNAIGMFSMLLARTLRPFLIPASKVLALDLDNVLWGGVLGEDGISGLKIGYDFPGNMYRRIQQLALEFKYAGVLLVLLSKNNTADVENAFSELRDMPLQLSDFSSIRVNWSEKHSNLKEMAEELNLGLDSFVFVDDQIFEREQMQFNHPEVRVLTVSEDPLTIINVLEECWLFDQQKVSQEDLIRSHDYSNQIKRRLFKKSTSSPEHFLRTLKLKALVSFLEEHNVGRAVQMLGKTNQFNITSRRHPETQVRAFMRDSQNILLTLSLSDRFGDQGVVGLIVAVAETAEHLRLDSFLLSCRAIGRGAEDALWVMFIKYAEQRGFKIVEAEYIRSHKNAQVSDLLDRLGMHQIHKNSDTTKYKMSLPYPVQVPDWIEIL